MTTSFVAVNQPRTVLGSLTTTFTPPTTCENVVYDAAFWNQRVGWRGQSCQVPEAHVNHDATACWPPTTAGASYPSPTLTAWGFYSPGLVCPHGYTSACTATAKGVAQWPVQFEMLEGETAVGCCPTEYTCVKKGSGASCVLTTTSTVVAVATCDSEASMIPFLETFPLVAVLTAPSETSSWTGGDLSTISTTTIETLIATAPMIQINWRSTDLAATPASAPSSTTSTTGGPTIAANEEPNGTLTVGSIIGITVGCVVVLLAACAIGFLLRRRRQTKSQAGINKWNENQLRISEPLHQDHDPFALAELEDPRKPLEMTGTRCVAEMEATGSEGEFVSER